MSDDGKISQVEVIVLSSDSESESGVDQQSQKICEECDLPHDHIFGSGRFCSTACCSRANGKNSRLGRSHRITSQVWDQQAVIPQATSSVTLDGLFAASLGKPARRLDKLEKPTGRLEGLGKMGRLEGVGKPAGRLEGLGKRGPYKQGQGSTTDFTSQKSKRVTGGAGSNEEKIRQVVEVVEIDSGSGSETNQSRSDAEAEAQVEADDSQIIADRYNARKRMEASKADPTPDPHPRTPPQPSSKPSIPISQFRLKKSVLERLRPRTKRIYLGFNLGVESSRQKKRPMKLWQLFAAGKSGSGNSRYYPISAVTPCARTGYGTVRMVIVSLSQESSSQQGSGAPNVKE